MARLKKTDVTERENVLQEADKLIHGARLQHYGTPAENFGRIASLWSGYLGHEVTPTDVCSLMILLKVARVKTGGSYHRDSFVDAAGYAGLAEVLNEAEAYIEANGGEQS